MQAQKIVTKISDMRVFGLTGGLASGKSTVAAHFRKSIPVIDADDLARQVVEKGQPALREISARYGEDVLGTDGTLNRSALAAKVFSDPAALAALNKITHPRVQAQLTARLAELERQGIQTACYELPLLFENNLEARLRPTVLVSATKETQVTRAMARNGWSREQAEARIAAQLSLAEKAARADYVIHNDGPLEQTLAEADRVLQLILAQSASE